MSKCARNHLYDIEIVEEEQYRVKVHYVGYSSNYDEWIRKSEIKYKPVASTVPDHEELSPLTVLSWLVLSSRTSFPAGKKILEFVFSCP